MDALIPVLALAFLAILIAIGVRPERKRTAQHPQSPGSKR